MIVVAQDQALTTSNLQEKIFRGMYSQFTGNVMKKRETVGLLV